VKYSDIAIGLSAHKSQRVTEKLIEEFAHVTGDKNPLHLNEDYAVKTIFKGRIAHGMIVASFISALLSEKFPGGIYISQDLHWTLPVRINDEITVECTVINGDEQKHEITLTTKCYNQKEEIVLEGTAIIKIID